ncbi:type II secretion system F family protein [Xylophilus sp.]|uniref:type II secretion system F family protein n=1 Tax=Xylophilus sp. TaxID=2653893 RepID=UPI0013B755F8|nr:type II secretion system F family protein [Xylophilus sp.]KAF1041948.1 MAG: hypothetical protein GAK38_04470 [Xylophilus sp.]
MSSGLLVLLALAAGLGALGLWLWLWSLRQQSRHAAVRHLDQYLEPRPPRDLVLQFGLPAVDAPPAAAVRRRPVVELPGWLAAVVSLRTLALGAALALLTMAAAALALGPLPAAALAVLLPALGCFSIWLRLQKLRRRLVEQLPGLIDAVVRLIGVGHSMQSAFQQAVPTTKPPLRDFMERAAALARAGVDLEQALQQAAEQARVEELHLFAAVVGLGVRFGGRADQLLERVAAFIRDREQAEAELHALSAETRLSAWVLGLLPTAVGGLIIVLNAAYFLHMWNDPAGRTMVYAALGLQLFGGFLLYRLARLE